MTTRQYFERRLEAMSIYPVPNSSYDSPLVQLSKRASVSALCDLANSEIARADTACAIPVACALAAYVVRSTGMSYESLLVTLNRGLAAALNVPEHEAARVAAASLIVASSSPEREPC